MERTGTGTGKGEGGSPPPEPNPSGMVFVGYNSEGKRFFALPPAPIGAPYQCFGTVMDFVAHPEEFMLRKPGEINGSGPDTRFIIQRNLVENRKLGPMRDWKELWGREKGKICLMVCAGPSLTESLPEIAELARDKDTYFTMGFNRSHRAMDLDYFVSMDRRAQPDWITRPTDGCKFISVTTGSPKIAAKLEDRYWGESFLCGVDEGMTPLRTGMAITQCDAMHAAYKLGAKEIWLYGSDFAVSGSMERQGPTMAYKLGRYYFDTPFALGFKPSRTAFPHQFPVGGIHGTLCFMNYQLWVYACYAFCMCMMLEKSGGIIVRNRSRAGILKWRTDEELVRFVPYNKLHHRSRPAREKFEKLLVAV